MSSPVKDVPTVRPDGSRLEPLIAGVVVRHQAPVEDERGGIVEVYRPSWGVHDEPLVYVYQITIMPGVVKGWVQHEHQDDRLFVSRGRVRFALYDDREGSPTRGRLNVFTITDRHRALVVIPKLVFHGVENVGLEEAVCINMPTRPYAHDDPDKSRLPLVNDRIPFDFGRGRRR